jgi:hypothetical protein
LIKSLRKIIKNSVTRGITVSPLQIGSSVGERQSKRPRAEGWPLVSSFGQLLPAQVTSDREGEGDPSVWISGEERGLTPHPDVQQVLDTPTTVVVASSSSFGEPKPALKKVRTKGCLSPSACYAHVGCCTLLM